MLTVRRQHDDVAIEAFQELHGSHSPVSSFVGKTAGDGDTVLSVNNLPLFSQLIELNLPYWNGYTPVQLTG